MVKEKDYVDRQVDTSTTMTHVSVIDKALLAKIAKEGAKAKYPLQLAPEILAKTTDDYLSVLLDWEVVGLDPLGEPVLPCGPMVRCKLLVDLFPGGPREAWVDMSRARYKSLPAVPTPLWPAKLPGRKKMPA